MNAIQRLERTVEFRNRFAESLKQAEEIFTDPPMLIKARIEGLRSIIEDLDRDIEEQLKELT